MMRKYQVRFGGGRLEKQVKLLAGRLPYIIVDHWNPSQRRYRTETFCYGPKICRFYKPGPERTVPGRHGMVWIEEDWVDEDATSHRDDDE